VVIAAFIPRAIGIEFGLPIILHGDEHEPIGRAGQLLAGVPFTETKAWRYPQLLTQLLAIERWLHACDGCDVAALVLRGRWLSAMVSALAAGLLADAGRRLGLPIWAAALGGMLFGWCPLEVCLARYATPDALMIALVAASIWACVGLALEGRRRDYLLCGLSVGLATAAKYNAAIIFVMVVVIHVLARGRDRQAWLRLVAAGLLSVGVFGLTLLWPWAGLEPFLGGLRYEWRHYGSGHDGFDCANAGWEAVRYVFAFALGPIACSCLVAGVVVAGRTGNRSMQVFQLGAAAFVIAYLALLGRQNLFFARLVGPMIPALALLVAAAAASLAEAAERRFGRSKRSLILTSIVGLVLLLPAVSTIEQVRAIRAPDTRLLAYRWLEQNLREPDVKIAVMPKSTRVSVPEGVPTLTVYLGVRVDRLEEMGVTHVLFGAGSIDRFRWRPEDNVEALEAWDGFHEQLRAKARLIQRWEQPPLPDAAHFGDSARTIHHSAIELWALD
jgi:hypothetical protein